VFRDLLPYLQCPTCGHSPLDLRAVREDGDEVLEGSLACRRCGRIAPIDDGMLDVLEDAPVPWAPAQLANYLPAGAWAYERLWRWQALRRMTGGAFPLSAELRLVSGLLEPQRGGLVLDVACSTGLYARACALVAPRSVVVAVDHSAAMLRETQRYARRAGLRISCMRAAAQALPFRTGVVSAYGIGGSLNEVGDVAGMLSEARRLLDADGRFVSMHLLRATSIWGRVLQRLVSGGGIIFPGPGRLADDFKAAGLRRVAEWRWRVVSITLLLPAGRTAQ
jgi:SAM-dependent methyltransferase